MSLQPSADPYLNLAVDDHVMLSSPLVDPVHWREARVLWRDDAEVLVRHPGFDGKPQNHLLSLGDVRVFGAREHCRAERDRAAAAVRSAADMASEVEEMAADLRHKMTVLFEQVAIAALAQNGASPRGTGKGSGRSAAGATA